MTAATASSSIPAEICYEPFSASSGPFSDSRSRLSASAEHLAHYSAGDLELAKRLAALHLPALSDVRRLDAGQPTDRGSNDLGQAFSDRSASEMHSSARIESSTDFVEAGPSRLSLGSSSRVTFSEDETPLSPWSDSTAASPYASTPRAASPISDSEQHEASISDKGKGRASEEQLAELDETSIEPTSVPMLSASATSTALQAQALVSQHLTQPLLHVIDEVNLRLDPPPPAIQVPSAAGAGIAERQPNSDTDRRSAPTQADGPDSDDDDKLVLSRLSRTTSESGSTAGSYGDFEDALEGLLPETAETPDESPAGLSEEAVPKSIGREAASGHAQQDLDAMVSGARRHSTSSSPSPLASGVAERNAVATEDSAQPVFSCQTDISRTPSTSTTGSSHTSSLDTAISSSLSTAASSYGPEHLSADTLKVTVSGEASIDQTQNSPLSFVSETDASPMLEDPSMAAADGRVLTQTAVERDEVQSSTPSLAPTQQDTQNQAKIRRYAALLELVETERNYADDLATLVLVFFDNLYSMPYFEDQPTRHALVLRNSNDLLRLHQKLSARMDAILSELGLRKGAASSASTPELAAHSLYEKAMSPQADEAVIRVAKLFSSMMPALQSYKAFCSRHGEALTLIREAEKRHADWDAFEKRCSDILRISRTRGYGPGSSRPASGSTTPNLANASPASYFTPITPSSATISSVGTPAAITPSSSHSASRSNSSRLLFRDFLIKPIQRLCLYPLVLQTLLKHTPAGSAGWAELSEAIASIREVADQVDEAGRRRELELMADLIVSRVEPHHGVSPSFLRSLGECRLAGTLDVLHHHRLLDPLVAPLRFKYLGVFLYDGFVLLVKVKKASTYECRQWFPLWAARLSNVEEGSSLLPHSFRLSVRSHHFEIAASNARERQVWVKALSDAISTATVSPPGSEASFPSSLSLDDGSDSDSNAASEAATPSASRGSEAASYWDVVKDAVGDPLMEFFALHAAGSLQTSSSSASSSSAARSQKPSAAAASASASVSAQASASISGSNPAAAAAESWIPTEILLRHASPSSRSIVDRGMIFSDVVLNARSSKEAGDLSSLWLPHNPTIGSAVGTAMGFGRLSARDTSTVKIQRRKSCVGSLESAAVVHGLPDDNPVLFTATVVQPGTKSRSSTKSGSDFAGISESTWKASLRKKANKVRPPSIFAPSGLTVLTDDISSPKSPHSASSTPTSPVGFSKDLQAMEHGAAAPAASIASAASLQPVAAQAKARNGTEDQTVLLTSSPPRSSHTTGHHSGLNSAASSIANLRSAAAADGWRRSSLYGVKDTLAASFGGLRSRTKSAQTDVTDLSAELPPSASSRATSPLNSSAVLPLPRGGVVDEHERPDLDALAAEQPDQWKSGPSTFSRPASLRRALTNAALSTRKRTQSDVGMLHGLDRAAAAAATGSTNATAHPDATVERRLQRSDTNVTMPVDGRRNRGASLIGKKGLGKRQSTTDTSKSTTSLGNSLRRSRTMLSSGRAWFGSRSSVAATPRPTTAVGRVHAEKVVSGSPETSRAAFVAPARPERISPRISPTLAAKAETTTGPTEVNSLRQCEEATNLASPSPSVRHVVAKSSAASSSALDSDENSKPKLLSTSASPLPTSKPLFGVRSQTEPNLASLAAAGEHHERGRIGARSESAPAVPLIASSESPKRGSKVLHTLRFLQSNRLSPVPLKALAETSIEHSATDSSDTAFSPSTASHSSRYTATLRRARSSLPARLSKLETSPASHLPSSAGDK